MLIYLVDLPNIQTLAVVLLVSAARLQILEFASKVWAEAEENKILAILHMRQFVQKVMHDSTQFFQAFALTFWVTGGAGVISRAAMNTTRLEHNGEDHDRKMKIISSVNQTENILGQCKFRDKNNIQGYQD